MERVIRNVADINSADRRAIEQLIGTHLAEHQQVVISVVNFEFASAGALAAPRQRECLHGGTSTKG